MEEEFISLAYFSLQLTRDMFVLYNTYENIIVSLDKSVRIRGVHACACVRYQSELTARGGTSLRVPIYRRTEIKRHDQKMNRGIQSTGCFTHRQTCLYTHVCMKDICTYVN